MNKIRRKELQAIKDQLEELKCSLEDLQAEEEEYRDNMPENLQGGEKYEHADETCDSLSDAVDSLEEAIASIEEAMSERRVASMSNIHVLIKEPGKTPRSVWISNTLENLQKIVGGYIETVTVASDLVIICDEEGRNKGKEHCGNICGVDFAGTIIIAGVDGEEFANIPADYQTVKRIMPQLWK